MNLDSILRKEEAACFAALKLSGAILDLGGEGRSGYLDHVQGDHTITTVNMDAVKGCDVVHDLEVMPLPFESDSYDVVILNNTIEHIFHARELVTDAVRVLRPGGMIIITAPFLFPVHPSPYDFWRFTEEALRRMLEESGAKDIACTALGTGVVTVSFQFLERLLPVLLRRVAVWLRFIPYWLDRGMYAVRSADSKQLREYHTLGYFVVASK